MLSLKEFKQKVKSLGTSDAPLDAPVETFWCFESTSALEPLWGYLTDTSRLNRELGLAPRTEHEVHGRLFVQTTVIGLKQEWLEEPWTWVQGTFIRADRIYKRGMAKRLQACFYIDNDFDPNKRLIYIYFGWTPAHAGWTLFIKATDRLVRKRFAGAFEKIDRFLRQASTAIQAVNAFTKTPVLDMEGLDKLAAGQAELLALGLHEPSVTKLCEWIAKGDDVDLESIKVRALARTWGLQERDLLTSALHATRAGLLMIGWRVICPHCRASRFTARTLGDVPGAASCEACDIRFTTDAADAIEVVFNVHPSVRDIPNVQFCASEPAKKAHIKIFQCLDPGSNLSLSAKLPDGAYRLRISGQKKACRLIVSQDASASDFAVQDLDFPECFSAKSPLRISYENKTNAGQTYAIEQLWWDDTALKPAHVFALPEFRDIFSHEHLKAGVKLHLGDQAILFTDIVGSSDFYEVVGDARAFAEVNSHFQELYDEVKVHRGVIVKTIGDAIMASFPSVQDAMRAAVEIQTRFHPERTDTSIRLRISVHVGPVIAVHLNTGIDYFGSTVNFAAKLQASANGGEIAMSEAVYRKLESSFARERSFAVDRRMHTRGVSKPVALRVVRVWASTAVAKAG